MKAHDHSTDHGVCALTGKPLPRRELVHLDALRPALADAIRQDHPELPPHALVALDEIAQYRLRYVNALLQSERGELGALDREVAESLARSELIPATPTTRWTGSGPSGSAWPTMSRPSAAAGPS